MRAVSRVGLGRGIRDGSPGSASENLPGCWAKRTDCESVWSVETLRRVREIAHELGWTDERMAAAVSRPGRHVGVHTFRSWFEPHRSAMVHFADVVRLVAALPEEASRPLVEGFAALAGMMAIDMPETRAGGASLERGALEVGRECGELQAAVLEATADGEVDEGERERIAEEARDVSREGARCAIAAGG